MNRKIHIYLGLYLILFLWLFSISGLVMNHPRWFGHQPQRSTNVVKVAEAPAARDLDSARQVAGELGLSGEILLRAQPRPDHFNFMLLRPHQRFAIDLDLEQKSARVVTVRGGLSGALEMFHTFSGVREIYNEPEPRRDWIVTRLWSFSMDAICVGVILLVVTSLVMAARLADKRRGVVIAIGAGLSACGFFVWGLRWLG